MSIASLSIAFTCIKTTARIIACHSIQIWSSYFSNEIGCWQITRKILKSTDMGTNYVAQMKKKWRRWSPIKWRSDIAIAIYWSIIYLSSLGSLIFIAIIGIPTRSVCGYSWKRFYRFIVVTTSSCEVLSTNSTGSDFRQFWMQYFLFR